MPLKHLLSIPILLLLTPSGAPAEERLTEDVDRLQRSLQRNLTSPLGQACCDGSKGSSGNQVYGQDFCARPLDAICGAANPAASDPSGQSASHSVRAREIHRELAAINRYAMEKAEAKALGLGLTIPAQTPRPLGNADLRRLLESWPEPQAEAVKQAYYAAFADARDGRIRQAEAPLPAILQTVKSLLGTVIDHQLSAAQHTAERQALKQAVRDVELLTPSSLARLRDTDSELFAQLDQTYRLHCGASGMNDNAVSKRIGARRFVVLCPGKLLAAEEGGDSQAIGSPPQSVNRHAILNLLRTLAHETSHAFDFNKSEDGRDFSTLYGGYIACLRAHYAARIPSGAAQFSGLRLGEITSDFWGNEVVAEYALATNPRPEILPLLRETHGALCDTESSERHPSGDFRIAGGLASDPRISTSIFRCGCSPQTPARAPACDLSGSRASPPLPSDCGK